MVFKLQSGGHCILFSAQPNFKGAKLKIYIQELWFLRSAHRLMLVNISMTFHEDILNGFQVTDLQSRRQCILFLALFTNDLTPTGRL